MSFHLSRLPFLLLFFAASPVTAIDETDTPREWTSVDGKKLTGAFLGTRNGSVYLKLPSGKTVPVPITKLSDSDQAFVTAHPRDYGLEWKGWNGDVTAAQSPSPIRERSGGNGVFFYTTGHFQFETDMALDTALLTDLGRLFELAHALNSRAPLGIRSSPDGEFYQAKLCSTHDQYQAFGGRAGGTGHYDFKKLRYVAPLDEIGFYKDKTRWRKSERQADSTSILHDLTRMLTHDTSQALPLWLNEGYANYLSFIPLEGGSFKTSDKKIAEGLLNVMAYQQIKSRGLRNASDIGYGTGGGKSEREDPKKIVYTLRSVSEMLEMPDDRWCQSRSAGLDLQASNAKHHMTAALIAYYFFQIEGEQGARKVAAMLDRNKSALAKLNAHLEDTKRYNAELEAFKRKPGVRELPDGQLEYPTSLTPPVRPPDTPPVDPGQLKRAGIEALLGTESAATVGARIERSLQEHLGVQIQFNVK